MVHVQILGSRGVPARHGGFETFAHDLSLYLVERGHPVTVYCQAGPSEPRTEDVWNGVRRIAIPAGEGPAGTIAFDWKSTLHACREQGIPLILGYNTAIFSLVYRLRGKRSLMNMDGLEWQRTKWTRAQRLWLRMNERAGAVLSDHLVADHPEIGRHLERIAACEKISMIPYSAAPPPPSGADSARLAELGVEPGKFALAISRLEPENSILEMVEAFSARPRGLKLLVIGRLAPEQNAYHRRVIESARAEVLFRGALYDRGLVNAVRSSARAYLHGHRVGGTNPSLVESLAAGNPIVAQDNVFNRWVAGEGAAYFRDAGDLARVLDEVLEDGARLKAMRAASLQRHAEEFTAARVLPVYEELLERFGSARRLPAGAARTELSADPATRRTDA